MDYRAFFVLGMCLISLGVSLMATLGASAIAFLGSGVTFMTLGLANRGRWAESKTQYAGRHAE
jgi:hypothetical protein